MPGLGFGLYIAYRLAKLAGGELSYETTEGSGTTFHLELPILENS